MGNYYKSGYLYVATGQKYIDEVKVSAASLKRINRNAHISIVADRDVSHDGLFDEVIVVSANDKELEANPNCYDMAWKEGLTFKVRHMYSKSPYERTLFVDSDTYFYDCCSGIFDLLDYFDAAMTLAPSERTLTYINEKCLEGYIPYNTGVILFGKNPQNELLFKNWIDIYDEKLEKKLSPYWENKVLSRKPSKFSVVHSVSSLQ